MDQPSHSYGLAGAKRHEAFRPESFRGFGVRRLDAAFGSQAPLGEVLASLACLADE